MKKEFEKILNALKEAKAHLQTLSVHLSGLTPTTEVTNAVEASKPLKSKLDEATKVAEKMADNPPGETPTVEAKPLTQDIMPEVAQSDVTQPSIPVTTGEKEVIEPEIIGIAK